jgi:hypothetical protein
MDELTARDERALENRDELPDADFEREFGEPLRQVLDLDTWHPGADLHELYDRLEAEVAGAIAQEDRVRDAIRSEVFPRIVDRPNAPRFAGVHPLSVEQLEKVHRGVLFCGDVEACDGTMQIHDSLGLTVIQIGVCLVGYRGDEGTWAHRLYRRDLRGTAEDPIDEALKLLELRDQRASVGVEDHRDRLTELGSRGVMTYAERAVLTDMSRAPWRMGHGNPAPYEIMTGSGALRLVEVGLAVLRRLLLEHRKFVFVPSAPRNRGLLTIGQALRPLEFAVVRKLRSQIEDMVEKGGLRGSTRDDALDFVETAGEEVSIGVFRVSASAPPYVFYAPADPELCAQAAAIAMADAALQEHRGFPLLIDMADQFCHAAFGRDVFIGTLQSAYAAQGRPVAYLSERETRR